jgi:hypothetical protein
MAFSAGTGGLTCQCLVGSSAGFALKVDGVVVASDPCMMRLAEKVDAAMAGASDYDADFICQGHRAPTMADA